MVSGGATYPMWPLSEDYCRTMPLLHRRAIDKTNIKSKPTTISEHLLSLSNHSRTDIQLIPLEKIHSPRDSVRKARESHLVDGHDA